MSNPGYISLHSLHLFFSIQVCCNWNELLSSELLCKVWKDILPHLVLKPISHVNHHFWRVCKVSWVWPYLGPQKSDSLWRRINITEQRLRAQAGGTRSFRFKFIQQFNKLLKLGHLYCRCNIDCFCFVSAMKIVLNKDHTAKPSHISQNTQAVCSHYWWSNILNESVDSKIQLTILYFNESVV